MNTIIGLIIIAIGSLGQSSSYVPINKVKNWSWECFWLIQGIFAWLLFPLLGALITLNEQQKKDLSEGKAVYLEGMKAKNGNDFNATVQINADRRSIEFKFDNTNRLSQEQSGNRQKQNQETSPQFRIPNKLLGVELSQDQQDKLRENKTIYVTGMKDKAGESFNAYVKVNTEKEKLDFFRWNPDKAQKQGAEVTPDNNSKTQVAVNSEGKTNEATKDAKEPLKQGQQQPSEKQQEKKEEQKEEKKVVKSKGVRM